MNDCIIGWDISTSAIGVCVKRDGATEFHVIFPKGDTHLEKWRSASRKVRDFMEGVLGDGLPDPIHHIVEERLGGFTGGRTSKQTLLALAAMNAVVSTVLASTGKVVHIAPVTTKRIMKLVVDKVDGDNAKKKAVIKLARSSCENFPYSETKSGNWVKGTDDMADAWLLAEAYSKVLKGEESLGSTKKAPKPKDKVGGAKGKKG